MKCLNIVQRCALHSTGRRLKTVHLYFHTHSRLKLLFRTRTSLDRIAAYEPCHVQEPFCIAKSSLRLYYVRTCIKQASFVRTVSDERWIFRRPSGGSNFTTLPSREARVRWRESGIKDNSESVASRKRLSRLFPTRQSRSRDEVAPVKYPRTHLGFRRPYNVK